MSWLLWAASLFTVVMTVFMQTRSRGVARGRPFSVVIVARNEQALLPLCLTSIERLDYPADRLEVVLVDDTSDDNTPAIMAAWCAQSPNRRWIRLETRDPALPGKKAGLTRGIAEARHPYIALTDADCTVPPNWLATFDATLNDKVGMVTGLFEIEHLTPFVRFKRVVSSGVFAATVGAGMPFSASGANLCLSREAFDRVGGLSGSAHIAYGDDKLLLTRIARAGYRIAIQTDARVTELPRARENRWLQNQRHFGKFALSSPRIQLLSLILAAVFVIWPVAWFQSATRPSALGFLAAMIGFYLGAVLRQGTRIRPYDLALIPIYPYFVFLMSVLGTMRRVKWR